MDFKLNLRPLQTITKFKEETLHIIDIHYKDNKLYILDHKKGLYSYNRNKDTFS